MSFLIVSTTITCCYCPPSLDDNEILGVLNSIPLMTDTILCGDFNARLGPAIGDHATTTRGRMLQAWLDDHQLAVWNTDLAYGLATYSTFRNGQTHESIIDLFMSNFTPSEASMTVFSDLSLGSDHRLLSATVSLPLQTATDTPLAHRRLWNLSRLLEEGRHDHFVDLFTHYATPLRDRLSQLILCPPSSRSPIDQFADELYELIYSTLSQALGDKLLRPKHWKWFWTPELASAAKLRDRLYRRWRSAVGLDKADWWEKHHVIRTQDLEHVTSGTHEKDTAIKSKTQQVTLGGVPKTQFKPNTNVERRKKSTAQSQQSTEHQKPYCEETTH
jgi:hypothetical protein